MLRDHCVTTGLKQRHGRCSDNLAEAFRQRANESLRFAAERVILWSFRENVLAGKTVFEREVRRLIYWAIGKGDVRDPEKRDDVYQEVWKALEKRFRNPKPIRCHLPGYVVKVAKRIAMKKKGETPAEMEDERVSGASVAELAPLSVCESWEVFDQALARSREHGIKDRIILAQGMMLNWAAEKRLPTKELLEEWRRLGALPEDSLRRRFGVLDEWRRTLAPEAVCWFCSYLLNESVVEPWETPLVFAVWEGLNEDEALALVRELANATIKAVDQRVPRIRRTLRKTQSGGGR